MTAADRHARVTELFSQALERPTADREAWLDGASAAPDIRDEVRSMLGHHASSGLLDAPVLDRETDPLIGRTLGPWRVVGVLGRGGMGSVYRAERVGADGPGGFRQTAALKVVRLGGSPEVRMRFLHERALLADLDHPGIARLLDGGVALGDVPYLAMELVEGDPITDFADARRLRVLPRLDLFLDACEAVAYAHRRLIVHRDLKPDHVVVALKNPDAGGRGVHPRVKLLDFGVAKLLDDEATHMTRTGAGPLTPAYAAPEQFLGHPVTTATDVYALGVILYELLAGRRPYDLSRLTAAQAERTVCETIPRRPSELASSARARALRGDLDAIVLKALAAEPERRYPSAEALAEDVRRHLGGLPVRARPATTAYRIGRFVRRHRVGVAMTAATVGLVALLSALYGVRLAAERDAARAAAAEATAQAERAEAVAGFLEQVLRAPNARWYVDAEAKGPDTPIRVVLDEAARRVDADFADRPDLRADLHHVLGDTYVGLGMSAEAGRHHRATLAARESLYAAPHPKLAEALYYAAAYLDPDDVLTELDALERAAAMLRERPGGNNFPFILQELADFQRVLGDAEGARATALEGLRFVEDTFTPGHPGHRYRTPLRAALGQELARAALALGDPADAARWVAAVDSVTAHTPLSAALPLTDSRGRIELAGGRFGEAERLLASVRGDRAQLRPGARAVLEEAIVAETRTALADLYDATGRPLRARAERQSISAHLVSRDSLRQAYARHVRETRVSRRR